MFPEIIFISNTITEKIFVGHHSEVAVLFEEVIAEASEAVVEEEDEEVL